MLPEVLPFAVYIAFEGNCRQAFKYYQACFGGELTVQTLEDTTEGIPMSKQMREAVVCATLTNDYFKLMGTDLVDEGSIVTGNNVSIVIECKSLTERTILVNKLIGRNFCSIENINPLINVIDRYRINWILAVS